MNDYDIEIIAAPSILGLKPNGVEHLAASLLAAGLADLVKSRHHVIHAPTLNKLYNHQRDLKANCLNTIPIRNFSITLGNIVLNSINKQCFALVLGGDCSILIGILQALKTKGLYGLIFIDAHADFYEPEKSITGEVADMDLAIVTGRGPESLININNQCPYVKDEHVVHIGQRDWEETKKFGSQDILQTSIPCFDLGFIKKNGIQQTTNKVVQHIKNLPIEGCWIHFDTDVLADEINPAVEYRLPGGLQFEQVEYCLRNLLLTGKIAGMSVTIFNPTFDVSGNIANNIVQSMGKAFDLNFAQSVY
ncbi:MAG TPA: arginase family protein [Pseudosphingobacterium sp.]|nr:arginase family protein [Pseudosphingobacterium sp.]